MWFLERIAEIIAAEEEVCAGGLPQDAEGMRKLKSMGFSDKRLAYLALKSANLRGHRSGHRARSGLIHEAVKAMTGGVTERSARAAPQAGVRPVFKTIDTCAAEFEAKTPYMYSTYEAPSFGEPECEAPDRSQEGRHPWRRPEPDRAGDRVRLLLLPCLLRAGRGGL
jgi:carbamoyl-phosphate synthase large subunit